MGTGGTWTDSLLADSSEIKARAEGIGMPVYPDKGRGLTDVGVGHYYQ